MGWHRNFSRQVISKLSLLIFFRADDIETWGRGVNLIGEKTTVKRTVEKSVKTTVKTPNQILQVLRKNPKLTLAQIAGQIGKSLRTVERASSRLVKSGKLQSMCPKKGGYWRVEGG